MGYCARYRFKILQPIEIPDPGFVTITIPGLTAARLEIEHEAYPLGHWAILTMAGFETEAEARLAGQRLGDVLLVVGAVKDLGIDVGFSRPPTLQFSTRVHAAVKDATGRELRAEVHGLMVYEQDTIAPIGMHARGQVLLSPSDLENRLAAFAGDIGELTQHQRNCAALINDSFVPQTEGQFILRVSAVEALCGKESGQSFQQSCKTKIVYLLSDEKAKLFGALYRKRSKLVHFGKGRGELTEATRDILGLAVDLLSADIRKSSTPAGRPS